MITHFTNLTQVYCFSCLTALMIASVKFVPPPGAMLCKLC